MVRGVAVAGCCVVLAACGAGGVVRDKRPAAPPTTTSPPTTAAAQDTVEVRPPAGPAGTVFLFRGAKFQSGQKVAVEIDLPGGQVYKGQAHTATPDGMVKASYRTSASDPAGTYQVKVISAGGRNDAGHFEVTGPGPAATSAPKAPTTKKP